MQTSLSAEFRGTSAGTEAEQVLRKCVHCGFCNATCPTYQLLGDELDGPRGRIYQMKQVLEGAPATASARLHLDRCLTCRACETTCPSGVEYGKLLDIGREVIEARTRRPAVERVRRWLLERILSDRRRAAVVFALARAARPLLPGSLAGKVPPRQRPLPSPRGGHARTVILPAGCVQPTLTPRTNQAAALLLDRLGYAATDPPEATCCGALAHHLSFTDRAAAQVRRNIDAWWPDIENGAEAIIMTASGCGVMVNDYGRMMRDDPDYATRAARISELSVDLATFIGERGAELGVTPRRDPLAFHSPCTYQHGLKRAGTVERMLEDLGYTLTSVADAHLCCGSAGTYSLLQPSLSAQLLENKVARLVEGEPELIVTANVGCQTHIASRSPVPVKHFAELLAEDLS